MKKKRTKSNPMMNSSRRRRAYVALTVFLAVLVTAGVAQVFHLEGIAKTYQAVLTCTAEPTHGPGYADFFVHTHNEDCYDENGTLWCSLPEIEAHEHDETCYTTTLELICTTPESDGHHHTEVCYTRVRGDLTCGQEASEPVLDEEGNVVAEGHVHTDECYLWSEELTCGKTEGEGAHHHDDACYQSVTKLTCDKPVVVLHTHDEDCYTEDEDGNLQLTCGMLEVTEHVHTVDCFTVYETDDGEVEETEEYTDGVETVSDDQTAAPTEAGNGESGLVFLFPEEENETVDGNVNENEDTVDTAVTDEVITTDTAEEKQEEATTEEAQKTEEENNSTIDQPEESTPPEETVTEPEETPAAEPETPRGTRSVGGEKHGATVQAEIPDGAMTEYAKLELSDYSADLAKATILQKVNENAAEGEERDISAIYVLDIGFTAGGETVFPNGEAPIRITLRASEIRSMTAPKLYHLYSGTAEQVEDADFDISAGTVTFSSYGFSPFAVVDLTGEDPISESIVNEAAEATAGVSMPAQNFHEWTDEVDVYVEADEGAFPAGTTMQVTMVPQEEVIDALNEAAPNAMVRNVQAVDITFYDAEGNVIEPVTVIRVKMSKKTAAPATAAPAESTESVVMHVDNEGSAQIVENATVDNTTAEFESDSFSTYIFADLLTEEVLDSLGNTYTVSVTYGPEAKIPEGATLLVEEVFEPDQYEEYLSEAERAISNEERVAFARFFDISILFNGTQIQPAAPVEVKIEINETLTENTQAIHFGDTVELIDTELEDNSVTFSAAGFSVYGVVLTETIETTILTADGEAYRITVSFDRDAGIPKGAELRATEVNGLALQCEDLLEKAITAIGTEEKIIYSRFFDISILYEGNEVQPQSIVDVKIELVDQLNKEVKAIHFDTEDTEIIEAHYSEEAVCFKAESFSIYGVLLTEKIETTIITDEGMTYSITVAYDQSANIPTGATLHVTEIEAGTEEYDYYIAQSLSAVGAESPDEIDFARFFDIHIIANGVVVEPEAPVQITIKYVNGIALAENSELSIVHFGNKGTEIRYPETNEGNSITEINFEQNGFSVTGTIAGSFSGNNWPNVPADDYVLVVNSGSGAPYYAVKSDGSLTEVEYNAETSTVTFVEANATSDINEYYWTYYVSGGNHRLTSKTNPNNKIYPSQGDGGSALSNSTNSPGANQGYIYRGRTNYRYCVAINRSGTALVSQQVSYSYNSYTYPSNAAHFQFASNFEMDANGAYGTAESIILTGDTKTLRVAEVTTEEGIFTDFEDFTWTSSNTSVATVSKDPNTDAPVVQGVTAGTARITGTRTTSEGETEQIVWRITVKDKTSNSIVFLHEPQSNSVFANEDNIRPHDGYGNTEPTNYVKFVVVLADSDGNIILYNNSPNVELPAGSVVPDRYEFELNSSGVLTIEQDTLSGISVPGYSYAGAYAYFGWYNNKDLENMAVVSEFKNMGSISSHYPDYYSVLGFKTSRGNPQYQDYSQTAFGNVGYGYYAYNPTGCLMIVLQPVNENIAYRTSYHNDYNPNGSARTNVVDVTRSNMIQGDWISDQYRYDWYGETIMTNLTGADLTPPEDGYEFVGWFDSVDAEGNGTGNEIVGQTEDGNYYALKNGEKIIIRQNNDIYAKWRLVRGTLTVKKEITGNISETDRNAIIQSLMFTVTDKSNNNVVETISGSQMTWNAAGTEGTYNVTGLSAATTYTVTEGDATVTGYTWEKTIDYPGDATEETGVKVSKVTSTVVTVENNYIPDITVSKVVKTGDGEVKPTDINCTIYFVLKNKETGELVKDKNEQIIVRSICVNSGSSNPESVSFAGIPDGRYEVLEYYDANATQILNVGDVFDQSGTKKGPNDTPQSWEKWFQLFKVEAESPTGPNNNISIPGEPGKAPHITFTNTYTDVNENIEFSANKVWWKSPYNPINPAPSESVVFALFKEEGNTPVPVMITEEGVEKQYTITLDGTVDQKGEDGSWKAVFKNLPKLDAEGNTIQYLVKETEYPEGYAPFKMDNSVVTEMGETGYLTNNGGTIYNVKEIDLTAKKIWTASQEDNKAPVIVQLCRKYEGGTEETVGERVTLSNQNNLRVKSSHSSLSGNLPG